MKTISDCSRALRELLRKGVTSRRAKQSHERPEGRCVVCPYSQSEIVKNRCLLSKIKEVEVNSKRQARIGIWALAANGIIFPYSSAALLPQVGSLLGWSQQVASCNLHERLLLNHPKTPGFLASGRKEFNPGPEMSFCVINFY